MKAKKPDELQKQIKFVASCPDYTMFAIDLFCGAGGTSSGVEYARLDGRKCAEVVACVNHDANAIKSHKANHPHTLHFTEADRIYKERYPGRK